MLSDKLFMGKQFPYLMHENNCLRFELHHDKTNKISVHPSEDSDQSSLCTQWVAKDPSFLHADSEDSDQTGRMPRLI